MITLASLPIAVDASGGQNAGIGLYHILHVVCGASSLQESYVMSILFTRLRGDPTGILEECESSLLKGSNTDLRTQLSW